jgi:hypothetical protein
VLAAVAQDGDALRLAAAKLQRDQEVVLAAVAQNGHAFRFAATGLKHVREVVLAAVAQDGDALYHAAAELQDDVTLRQLRAVNLRVSAPLLAARLRLTLARLNSDALSTCLSHDIIELIGRRCTVSTCVLGLLARCAC